MDIQLDKVTFYAGGIATVTSTLGTDATVRFTEPITLLSEQELRDLLKVCRKARTAYKVALREVPDELDDD